MSESGKTFVSPTGYVDLDNDCAYSIDLKSTRSREYVDPKEDLSFYFQTYITPKYGLENLNVNNVASFMKDLEMNWSKLTPGLKDKVLDIMVDGIFPQNYDFKNNLLSRIPVPPPPVFPTQPNFIESKSNFGSSDNTTHIVIAAVILLLALALLYGKF
jgi:hypothetical protein